MSTPRGSGLRALTSCTAVARGCVESCSNRIIEVRTALSAAVAPASSSMPKTADMMTSRVICWPMSASATGSPVRQSSMRCVVAASIRRWYSVTARPWNCGSSRPRCCLWRGPTAVSTESGPTMGRSGENRVADGASSGRDISEAMWAGLETSTTCPGPPANSERKTSP